MRNTSLTILLFLSLLLPSTAWSDSALDTLEPKIEAAWASGSRPIVIFDLDDTLFDSRPRSMRIFLEFSQRPETARDYPEAVTPLSTISAREVQYPLTETLAALGLHNPRLKEELEAFWKERFFSNAYLRHDRLTPNARTLTQSLTALGARLVYLTGRDRPRMGEGTLFQLSRFALPLGSLGVLFMKPQAAIPDRDFKAGALDSIATLGSVVGAFENEPTNANLLQERFGDASTFLLETIESGKPIRLDPRVKRIRHL